MTTTNIFLHNGSREYLPDYNSNNYRDNDRYVDGNTYFYQNGGYYFVIILLMPTAVNISINAATQVLTKCILLMTLVATYQSMGLVLEAHAQFCPRYKYSDALYFVNDGGENISTTVAIKIITIMTATLVTTRKNILIYLFCYNTTGGDAIISFAPQILEAATKYLCRRQQ